VRENYRVQTRETTRPQIRRNNFLANIEFRMDEPKVPACIDQHCPPLGCDQETRICLSDVDCSQLENPGTNMRPGSMKCKQEAGSGQHRETGARQHAASRSQAHGEK